MKLSLAYYGNPVLRKKGARVEHIDASLVDLVNSMVRSMKEHNGVGLAAPQVGHSLALFITCVPTYNDEWVEIAPGKIKVYINPKITAHSDETWLFTEGCLSIPGLREYVERPLSITVEATDLEGRLFKEELVGYDARVVMHENDHINGVLFVDRLPLKVKRMIDHELRKIKKKYA